MSSTAQTINQGFNIDEVRKDFPILSQSVRGKPLVYLDNAATAQKPNSVIETIDHYYREYNSNIHRGVHSLSEKATVVYEDARKKCQTFLNAESTKEIIFVRGATEAINLVAQSYARPLLKAGDEILITEMEHHSNIVPWQLVAEQTGATLRYIPINDDGELILDDIESLLNDNTKILAIGQISNALGTINPIEDLTSKARAVGAKVLIDGAQSAPHVVVDVQELDCDFFVLSGHKLFGPTGIGLLYGKQELLDSMAPYQGGGDMIRTVHMNESTYNDLPYKFEAGTPHIVGAIGLGAAIDYINSIGMQNIANYEHELLEYATSKVNEIESMKIVGQAKNKASILSFTLGRIHPHDIGTILDGDGVAIRAGHHCAMPVMERFGLPATARASFAFYNTKQEIDTLFDSIRNCVEMLG